MKTRFGQHLTFLFFLSASLVTSCKKDSNNNPTNSNPDLATVTTDRVDAISFKTATVVSTVSKEGKSAVIGMGITYGKNPNPTVVADINVPYASFGVGTFITNLSNLDAGTTYYVRSYATNAVGTSYSEQKTFTTLAFGAPNLTTSAITEINERSAAGGGAITDQGSSPIVERGLVWSTSPGPTVSSPGKSVSTPAGIGAYTLVITGLNPGTQYYVRAYATNGELTAYGNEVNFTTISAPTSVTDIDGNVYPIIEIGTQTWMKENLKTTRYRDGSAITTGLSDNAWQNTTAGAYAIYDNDAANNSTYGKLYNWYAVADSRNLCPAGWHLPTDAEWTTLENFLGGATVAGGKMKTTTGWQSPNAAATNESGFSGLPGGYRNDPGSFNIGYNGGWWSSTENSTVTAWSRILNYDQGNSTRSSNIRRNGFSVRCLRD